MNIRCECGGSHDEHTDGICTCTDWCECTEFTPRWGCTHADAPRGFEEIELHEHVASRLVREVAA